MVGGLVVVLIAASGRTSGMSAAMRAEAKGAKASVGSSVGTVVAIDLKSRTMLQAFDLFRNSQITSMAANSLGEVCVGCNNSVGMWDLAKNISLTDVTAADTGVVAKVEPKIVPKPELIISQSPKRSGAGRKLSKSGSKDLMPLNFQKKIKDDGALSSGATIFFSKK